jgi:hypothetical protein
LRSAVAIQNYPFHARGRKYGVRALDAKQTLPSTMGRTKTDGFPSRKATPALSTVKVAKHGQSGKIRIKTAEDVENLCAAVDGARLHST